MTQKVQWEDTPSWEEWLEIWEENKRGKFSRNGKANTDVAIGLLHGGLLLYQFPSQDGLKNELERVKFYLSVARQDQHPQCNAERIVGNKAYQLLVSNLFWRLKAKMWERWASDLHPEEEATVWSEIINFFAQSKRSFWLDGEPYRSKAREFITALCLSLRNNSREPFLFSQEIKEILSKKRRELARALANVAVFDFLLQEEFFEAIPALKEKIFNSKKLKERFPQSRERWMKALERPSSRELVAALRDKESREAARTLMELLIRREARPKS